MSDLGKRAVACSGWRWMPGMSIFARSYDIRVVGHGDTDGELQVVWGGNPHVDQEWCTDNSTPNLDDPATLGCLLHLVREAWGDPNAFVFWDVRTGRWQFHVISRYQEPIVWANGVGSEREALVAALEAAP